MTALLLVKLAPCLAAACVGGRMTEERAERFALVHSPAPGVRAARCDVLGSREARCVVLSRWIDWEAGLEYRERWTMRLVLRRGRVALAPARPDPAP